MTNYKLSGGEKGESLVVVYSDGEPASIPGTHPNFDKILELLRSGASDDEAVKTLVNTLHVAGQKLAALTDRVSVAPYGVFFDGDPLRSELADVLTQLLLEDNEADLISVAKFLENAAANQTMEGIDAMYRWITNRDLVLTENGTFLAYKGVIFDGEVIKSITSGTAMVDGVVHTGQIPNPIGSIISMPRSEVTSETSIGCGPGLHAGTYSYANSFGGGNLVLVEINPRDVVSVPSDSSFQKLRVSKYKVVKKIEDRLSDVIYKEDVVKDDGDFTETGEVDEQPTESGNFGETDEVGEQLKQSLKDELESNDLFAGVPAPPAPPFVYGEDDDELDGEPEEEKSGDLGIDGHESTETKLRKFARWLKNN